jgi:hypothetical protein
MTHTRFRIAFTPARAGCLLLVTQLIALGAGCAPAAPTAVETRSTAIFQPATTTPPPATETMAPTGCLPSETADIVWPRLGEIQPPQIQPGGEVTVVGSGGYVQCGSGAYNESARSFQLFFGGQPASSIGCYVNRCEGKLVVPMTATAGTHVIAVEGGSTISLEVTID